MTQHFPYRKRQCPPEILQDLASLITNLADLCSISRCNTTTWAIGEDKLWKMDTVYRGKPALYWAIENNYRTVAEKALMKYTQLDVPGLLDGTAVQWTTFTWQDGTLAAVRSGSPVMLAVESGNMDMLELVVSKGCDLDMRCRPRRHGQLGSSIHETCHRENCREQSLLEFDDTWVEGPDGCESALHFAVWEGRPDMLRFLLEAGAEVTYKGRWLEPRTLWDCTIFIRDSVLKRALRMGFRASSLDTVHTDMLEILEEFGVNVSTNQMGHPAYHRLHFRR